MVDAPGLGPDAFTGVPVRVRPRAPSSARPDTDLLAYEKAIMAVLISIVVVNCGVLFEQKRWVIISEWLRIILYPAALMTVTWSVPGSQLWMLISMLYLVISVVWFWPVSRKLHAQK